MIWNGDSVVVPSGARVFAVAGIARPERFFPTSSRRPAGRWSARCRSAIITASRRGDVRRIAAAAKAAAAAIVLTTEKDAVRLAACDLEGVPIAAVPLVVGVEPADGFPRLAAGATREPVAVRLRPRNPTAWCGP